jgi:hypothetical protein
LEFIGEGIHGSEFRAYEGLRSRYRVYGLESEGKGFLFRVLKGTKV